MFNYSINKTGMDEIAEFIRANHKDGERLADDPRVIAAWAGEAEESLDNGNPPMIEIRAYDSVSGVPVEFTVSERGIEENLVEDS